VTLTDPTPEFKGKKIGAEGAIRMFAFV